MTPKSCRSGRQLQPLCDPSSSPELRRLRGWRSGSTGWRPVGSEGEVGWVPGVGPEGWRSIGFGREAGPGPSRGRPGPWGWRSIGFGGEVGLRSGGGRPGSRGWSAWVPGLVGPRPGGGRPGVPGLDVGWFPGGGCSAPRRWGSARFGIGGRGTPPWDGGRLGPGVLGLGTSRGWRPGLRQAQGRAGSSVVGRAGSVGRHRLRGVADGSPSGERSG
jgi:hypothetical protein